MIINTNTNIAHGMTFSEGLHLYRGNNDSNIFESIITVNTIECDDNLSVEEKDRLIDILNSNMEPTRKRLMIMRALDKDKDFSSKIAIVLSKRPGKMDMVKEIMTVFRDEYIKKDILKKDFGEVLTPISIVKEMISHIEDDFWRSPYDKDGNIKRVLETSNGSGIFLWYVLCKFMFGLQDHFPDEEERYKFIVENMLYACELQNSKMFNWICTVDLYDDYNINVYCGSYLDDGFDKHMKEVWGIESVHLTVSNPPYQETIEGNNRARPLYNLFIEKSLKISNKVLFITPSRWLAGGFGLDDFRKMMFNRTDIKIIRHFNGATKVFGNSVDIVGGVSYFLIDKEYNGDVLFNNSYCKLNKYDIWVEPKYHNLLDKVISDNNLSNICKSQSYYGFPGNESLFTKEESDKYLKVYVSKNKGNIMWVDPSNIRDISKASGYKVFTVAANGEKPNFGNKIIGYPNEVASKSFMTLITNSESESKSLISYMNTKFCNFFLSLRKNTQNFKPDTLKWIPLVPFDRQWNDELLFQHFNLLEEDKRVILNK